MTRMLTILHASLLAAAAVTTAHAAKFKTIYTFQDQSDGLQPAGSFVIANNTIYGGTAGSFAMGHFTCYTPACGTAFSFDLSSAKLKTIYAFAENETLGFFAFSGVTQVGSLLYGINWNDDGYGNGLIFSVDPATGKEQTVSVIPSSLPNIPPFPGPISYNNQLYMIYTGGGDPQGGHNYGGILQIDPTSGEQTSLYEFQGQAGDGWYPLVPPIAANGKLYGVTTYGGAHTYGTVWQFDLTSGKESVLYSFTGGTDGKWPAGGLVADGTMLYGTEGWGGKGFGSVWSLDTSSGSFSTLHAMNGGTEGGDPGALTINNGKIYVSSLEGGTGDWGTLTSMDMSTGKTKLIHAFQGEADGIWPGTLVAYSGKVYGLTQTEYPFVWNGTLFEIDP
jgi:uncharacterized repeat protein (TIGR03803 family)